MSKTCWLTLMALCAITANIFGAWAIGTSTPSENTPFSNGASISCAGTANGSVENYTIEVYVNGTVENSKGGTSTMSAWGLTIDPPSGGWHGKAGGDDRVRLNYPGNPGGFEDRVVSIGGT